MKWQVARKPTIQWDRTANPIEVRKWLLGGATAEFYAISRPLTIQSSDSLCL
jgi:hypothetical protein